MELLFMILLRREIKILNKNISMTTDQLKDLKARVEALRGYL